VFVTSGGDDYVARMSDQDIARFRAHAEECMIQADGSARESDKEAWLRAASPYMPRYFFNTRGIRPITDEEGEELPDNETAWNEATIMAGELFKDIDGKFRPDQEWALEVPMRAGTRSI
jgi:hypothetical protein